MSEKPRDAPCRWKSLKQLIILYDGLWNCNCRHHLSSSVVNEVGRSVLSTTSDCHTALRTPLVWRIHGQLVAASLSISILPGANGRWGRKTAFFRSFPSKGVFPCDPVYTICCQKTRVSGLPDSEDRVIHFHLTALSTSVWRTDGRTDGRTNARTHNYYGLCIAVLCLVCCLA